MVCAFRHDQVALCPAARGRLGYFKIAEINKSVSSSIHAHQGQYCSASMIKSMGVPFTGDAGLSAPPAAGKAIRGG